MSKLRKNEKNYLFYFESLFSLYQSQKINFLKAIDAAKFEVKKIKLYILQIIFQKKIGISLHIPKKIPVLVVCFNLFLFFSVCAFMRKVLADFSLALL